MKPAKDAVKHKKKQSAGTLDTFFRTPPKTPASPSKDVIELSDSDGETSLQRHLGKRKRTDEAALKDHEHADGQQIAADELFARRLAAQTPETNSDSKPPSSPRTPFAKKPVTYQAVDTDYPIDKDILEFQPARDIDVSSWPRDAHDNIQIPYAFLTAAFVRIGATPGRLLSLTYLVNTLRTVMHYQPTVLLHCVYLITNHVAPAYEGVELGLGGAVLSKAIKDVSGASASELSRLWNKYGDSGDVAFDAKSNVRTLLPTAPLILSNVYSTLVRIAGLKGQGVQQQKGALVQKLLVAAKGEEVRYIMRTFVSHLRIGAVRLTVTAALARAFCLTRVDGREAVEEQRLHEKQAKVNGEDPPPHDPNDDFWIPVRDREGVKAIAKTVKEGKSDPRRLDIMSTLERAEALVREVYVRHPNYNHIIPALLDTGLQGLAEAVPLAVGTPLSPMLGEITRDMGDIEKRLNLDAEFSAEWKYDGQRVQIHARRRSPDEPKPKDERLAGARSGGGKWVGQDQRVYVRLFSRHLEDMSDKYPDLVAVIVQMLEDPQGTEAITSLVADAEICAIDPDSGALLDFQTLSNRARKDVDINAVKVRVAVFAFDLMHLNGRSLLSESFRTRRQLLHSVLPPYSPADPAVARWDHVNSIIATPADLAPVKEFMAEAVQNRCEGIMVKILDPATVALPATSKHDEEIDLDAEDSKSSPKKGRRKALMATYEPDKRVQSWLKVKKDYGESGDSLDMIPIGAWHGQGRKAGWWSPLLLAVYDPETGGFQAVCKCISGFTDQFYKDLNVRYAADSDTCTRVPQVDVDVGSMVPQWWFKPSEVWEIRNADITRSPVYTAAKGLIPGERGLSVRFPRFIKVREDKGIEQANTPSDLAAAWHRQESGGKGEQAAREEREMRRAQRGDVSEDDEDEDDDENMYDVMDM